MPPLPLARPRVPGIDAPGPNDPPWIRTAFAELGQAEVPGAGVNPRILEYFKATYQAGLHADDTGAAHAWCAAFVTWVLAAHNYKTKRAVGAREYLTWGEPCAMFRGAVVVLQRSGQKHVAFADGQDPDGHAVYLGGNQVNMVSLATFPRHTVLGVRRPLGYRVPQVLAQLPSMLGAGVGTSTV